LVASAGICGIRPRRIISSMALGPMLAMAVTSSTGTTGNEM
jgi:hypothetical protein